MMARNPTDHNGAPTSRERKNQGNNHRNGTKPLGLITDFFIKLYGLSFFTPRTLFFSFCSIFAGGGFGGRGASVARGASGAPPEKKANRPQALPTAGLPDRALPAPIKKGGSGGGQGHGKDTQQDTRKDTQPQGVCVVGVC